MNMAITNPLLNNNLADNTTSNTGLRHLCLDIETCNAPESAIQTTMRFWRAPGNIKDEAKIETARLNAEQKNREKSAVLDGAPIGCVVLISELGSAVFSAIKNTPAKLSAVPAAEVYACADERAMLIAMRDWLNAKCSVETVLIGHNLQHFDLPKLRNAYIANKLRMPAVLLGDNPVYDTMREYIRSFTTEHDGDRWVKLAEIQAKFGLQEYKEIISGADAPKLIAAGEAEPVLSYCWLDTTTAYQAFLAMTGQILDEVLPVKAAEEPAAKNAVNTANEQTQAFAEDLIP